MRCGSVACWPRFLQTATTPGVNPGCGGGGGGDGAAGHEGTRRRHVAATYVNNCGAVALEISVLFSCRHFNADR